MPCCEPLDQRRCDAAEEGGAGDGLPVRHGIAAEESRSLDHSGDPGEGPKRTNVVPGQITVRPFSAMGGDVSHDELGKLLLDHLVVQTELRQRWTAHVGDKNVGVLPIGGQRPQA